MRKAVQNSFNNKHICCRYVLLSGPSLSIATIIHLWKTDDNSKTRSISTHSIDNNSNCSTNSNIYITIRTNTANPPTNIVDFRGFDSSIILI